MSTTTAIAVPDPPGRYLALNHDASEIEAIIADNLGGQELTEFDLPRIKVPTSGGRTWVLGQEVFRNGQINDSIRGREAQYDHSRGGYWA